MVRILANLPLTVPYLEVRSPPLPPHRKCDHDGKVQSLTPNYIPPLVYYLLLRGTLVNRTHGVQTKNYAFRIYYVVPPRYHRAVDNGSSNDIAHTRSSKGKNKRTASFVALPFRGVGVGFEKGHPRLMFWFVESGFHEFSMILHIRLIRVG